MSEEASTTRDERWRSEPSLAEVTRLLIVDDDACSLRSLQRLLKHQAPNLDVIGAHGAKEALESILAFQPHAILVDSNMPEIDGAEFCRRVKKAGATRDLPLVGMSGERQRERDLRAAGATAFLLKPIDTKLLLEALGQAETSDGGAL